jgi:hypothetical protein
MGKDRSVLNADLIPDVIVRPGDSRNGALGHVGHLTVTHTSIKAYEVYLQVPA